MLTYKFQESAERSDIRYIRPVWYSVYQTGSFLPRRRFRK